MEKAYFAGGCFWCIASVFSGIEGVHQVISGYSGGDTINPSYHEVKSQTTNHRETICVIYNENIISYNELLNIFINHVDLFDEGGQFIDRGFSYTLALFFQSEYEKTLIDEKIKDIVEEYHQAPAISVIPFTNFYEAEEEHQDYAQKNPTEFEHELNQSGRKDYFKN